MARKSRKQHLLEPEVTIRTRFHTAIYVRRSVKDKRNETDNSLAMQEELVRHYLKNKPEFQITKVYQDNGFSGTNFNRPSFQEMMEDIRLGTINAIVVKDLSRFGRNYIEVGDYLEKILPFMGVRFIAINDGYDNFATSFSEELIMHLLNITNDMYAKDLSSKIAPALKAKQERGEFLGPYPTFGYLRNPENGKSLVVDTEAADTVRVIFDLRVEGMGILKIVKYLTEQDFMTPNEYRLRKGLVKSDKYQNSTWTTYMVSAILKNETYLGHTVSGTTRKSLANGEKRRRIPPEDWKLKKNTHEPIISPELFQKVSKSMKNSTETYLNNLEKNAHIPKEDTLFKGIVYCSTCGQVLRKRREVIRKQDGTESLRNYYEHSITHYIHHKSQCTYKGIIEDQIVNTVSVALLQQQKLEQQILEKQNTRSYRSSLAKTKMKNARIIQDLTQKRDTLDSLREKAFEDFITDQISRKEYLEITNNYQSQIDLNEKTREQLRNESLPYHQSEQVLSPTSPLANLPLTPELVQDKIEKIMIFADKSIQVILKEPYQELGIERDSKVNHAT